MKVIRIAVTGGRDYQNQKVVYDALNANKRAVEAAGAKMFLVVGDATGADALARQWASENLLKEDWKEFKADWEKARKNGNVKMAGPVRNRDMLISGIHKLCAFPGGNGTADMTRICRNVGIHIKEYK
jgi:YspA, cpYpsA-related SLOG family